MDNTRVNQSSIITKTVKHIVLGTRALRLASRFTHPRIVILGYHSIQERPELYANSIGYGITHSASVFESQMKLVASKYIPVSLEEVRYILQGKKQLRKNAVAVTFDDGYRDNCDIADPILRLYGIPATFYICTSWIGTTEAPWFCRLRHAFMTTKCEEWSDSVQGHRYKLCDAKNRSAVLQAAIGMASSMTGDTRQATIRTIERDLDVTPLGAPGDLMMTWDHARKLRRLGHTVGSHTMTHPNVAHLIDEQIMLTEIGESKRRIEQELQEAILDFSYPHPALNPQWTPKTLEVTKQAGYQTAVTTTPGAVRVGDSPFTLARVMVSGLESDFRWQLERAFLA